MMMHVPEPKPAPKPEKPPYVEPPYDEYTLPSLDLLAEPEYGYAAVQEKVVTGVLFILLFALGHCLPIVVAGSSTAAVKRVMESSRWQGAGNWFRKGAGVLIGVLGLYFIVAPFLYV